jgi:hypothetical protein
MDISINQWRSTGGEGPCLTRGMKKNALNKIYVCRTVGSPLLMRKFPLGQSDFCANGGHPVDKKISLK